MALALLLDVGRGYMDKLSPADLNILVVEPSHMQRKLLLNALHEEGVFNLDVCSNCKDAFEQVTRIKPDLVISSLYFEDGTGLDLLRSIRQDSDLEDLPFMLVSSENRRAQLEEFKQSGVIAILPKPYTLQHLHRAVNATVDLLSPQALELDMYEVDDLRVLVVDDSRLSRNVITRVLTNMGVEHIQEADDGSGAIEILNNQTFDLLVTDYHMPEVNGAELTEYIRQSDDHCHMPVLMVTSEDNEAQLQNVAQSGVNALSNKPFEPDGVRKLLAQILEG